MSFVNSVWDSARTKMWNFVMNSKNFIVCQVPAYSGPIEMVDSLDGFFGYFFLSSLNMSLKKAWVLKANETFVVCFCDILVICLCNLARGFFTMNAEDKKSELTLPPSKNAVAWRPTL